MIHEVPGDILLSQAAVIAHGVAPNAHFDRGLALSLRERWPAMAKDFRHWAHHSKQHPGTLWAWGGAGGRRIVNLLTREASENEGGRQGRAKIEYVNHALKALREFCAKENIGSLALPRLATGLGGLDWSDVKPLVEHHLADLNIPVYVYATYKAGQAAPEKV